MYRHGIPLVPQELLGYYLGLTVSKENKYLFWNPRTGKRPPSGWGTQASRKRYSMNKAFQKLGIPIKARQLLISEFNDDEYREYLKQIEKNDMDVMVCFDHRVLNRERKTKRGKHQGHLCVIDRVDLKNNKVRLIDPSPKHPKWRVVDIDDLKQATDWHYPKAGGFWEFRVKV